MFSQLTGAIRRIFHPQTGDVVSITQQELKEPRARASQYSRRQPAAGVSVASYLTPQHLARVLRTAADGNPRDFFILAEELEERDLHYAAVLRTRKLTVAGIEPVVESPSDDAKDVEITSAVRMMLARPQIPELMFDLLDGLGKGVGVSEILWDTSGKIWVPRDYEWVDPRFLEPDRETLRQFCLLTDASPVSGEPLLPGKFIIHQPRLKSGLPLRNGLARLVSVMYMLKSFTVRDWWAFAEKFGLPLVVGKYGANASEDDIRVLVDAIATLASDAGCAIPASMQLDMVETASRNNGGTLFRDMAQWCDAQISKAVLGQTMTTDDGSSLAQATIHDRVRMDIVKWDARQLANTLSEYLVQPFVVMNFGPRDEYPAVKLLVDEPEDLKALVDALGPMIDRGMAVQMSEVRDRFGFSEPEEDAVILHPVNTAVPQTETALNREWLSLNRAQNSEREIDALVNEGLRDWQRDGDTFTSPVLELVQTCRSFDEFRERLPALQEQLDAGEFVTQLAELSFRARALGDTSDG